MNPRLVKFAVELQNGEKIENTKKNINFRNGGGRRLFDLFKLAKITVPIDRNQ